MPRPAGPGGHAGRAGIFQPVHATRRASAIAVKDVGVAVAIHVLELQGHGPAHRQQRIPAPACDIARGGGRFQPAQGGTSRTASRPAAQHEIDPVSPVELCCRGEHPPRHPRGRRENILAPRGRLEASRGFRRTPLHENPLGGTFGAGVDIERAVPIQIDEHRVFRRRRDAHHHFWPRPLGGRWTGIEVHARGAVLLPTGGDIGSAIAVKIAEFGAVRPGPEPSMTCRSQGVPVNGVSAPGAPRPALAVAMNSRTAREECMKADRNTRARARYSARSRR
jgi:hypothetical protein